MSAGAAGAELSALQHNIQTKGKTAYYYAHDRDYEVPSHAKVVSGPGLITGGTPERIASEEAPADQERKVHYNKVTKFCWADSGDKVKVYIELVPEMGELCEDSVESEFCTKSATVTFRSQSGSKLYRWHAPELSMKVLEDECSVRVRPNKITVTLKKASSMSWSKLCKDGN